MSKLRLIKQRAEDHDVETDLRGLGDTDVVQASAPYAALAVRGLGGAHSEAYLKDLLAAYDLAAHPAHEHGVLHLRARALHAGEHKLQAVTLFVAALDILKHHPGASVLLTEVSQLHERLQNGMRHGGHSRHDLLEQRVSAWQPEAHALTIDAQVTWHLRQAGFDLEHADNGLKLTSAELERHARELSGAEAVVAHVQKRKVG